ncbi:TPA: hypothetical protein I8271_004665 [Kluyvera intermedia]|uniref:Uncharacterized protein n=1 Tax=Kluyvera intermedia TaxID=61648 RepID=A0A9P3TB73_KLUIN|nr:hypothetical protein [Phytobacter ursingii]HAT2207094.1 hypothetical protein [Kluyvera intermedia]HAT2517786.1 hypothetical protein [Kluyvera intermedia]HAT2605921.1 hypothetical protein [Kluyvera intermedia]HAT2682763.1 hypothetical protein [Kluyvera intermedia]HAT2699233.1 hypothetical protein [Kluyvera intermedia]
MKRLIVGALKILVFVGGFTFYGLGMYPSVGGGFALFFLSLALLSAWIEIKSTIRK